MTDFRVGQSRVINTMAEFAEYKAWAAAQVCGGCDTPGCGPGCGRKKSEARPGEWWVTETCCWQCHFHSPQPMALAGGGAR